MTSDEFTRRVAAMRQTLYRVCRTQLTEPADRDDAVQEAIFRAWQKRDTLRDARYFETWFIRILLNQCHDLQRQRRRFSPTEPPEPPATDDVRLQALMDALAALEEGQRLCVLLHYIEGYSVKETAKMLGIGESCAKLRLLRGRKKLRELLSEEAFE